jgi:hypothetical protein
MEAITILHGKPLRFAENPITGLADTIQSRELSTVFVRRSSIRIMNIYGTIILPITISMSGSRKVYLTVTDITHGCQTEDSVYIELLFNDVGIDSIIWPVSFSELSNAEHVQIQIRNFGTDSLIIGDKIVLYYELDGGAPVADSIILTAPFYSGARMRFTFDEKTENFSAIDSYSILAYADYGGDTVTYNDSIARTINVWGYPTLFLGNDTVINGISYMLDVDPTFESYLWNDGVTTGTRLIDTSGVYWLDVLGRSWLSASDTSTSGSGSGIQATAK